MPDLSHGASELDARLAEIDRKLRAIQVDLDPDREPRLSRPSAPVPEPSEPPPPPPSEPEPPAPGAMVPSEMHAKLVSAMRDLLDAYGWTLQQLPVAADPQRADRHPPLAMSVGPFATTAVVRAFEAELVRLPGVREVVLRGYEGENRAMFDVQLSAPNA